MSISTSIKRDGGLATVVVAGEIDVSTAPAVEETIREAITADGVGTALVDLSAVQFLDSSGVGLLLKGRRLADKQAISYRVAGAQGIVRQVLELSGVWNHLCGGPDRDAPA